MNPIQQSIIGSVLFIIGIPINGFFLFGMLFESLDNPIWDINMIPLELISINFGISFIGICIVLFNWNKLEKILNSENQN